MRKTILLAALIVGGLTAWGQEVPEKDKKEEKESPIFFEKPKPEWQQKLRYGGNFWLQFWGSLYIDASPMVGYEITDKGTVAGVGMAAIYQGSLGRSNIGVNTFSYGPRFFVRQQVFRSIFAHAEYEFINARSEYMLSEALNTSFNQVRKWEGAPYVGVGFYQGRGNRRGSFIMLMYNLTFPDRGYISPLQFGGQNSPFVLRLGFF